MLNSDVSTTSSRESNLNYYTHAFSIDDKTARLLLRGERLQEKGQLHQALVYFDHVLAICPSCTEAAINKDMIERIIASSEQSHTNPTFLESHEKLTPCRILDSHEVAPCANDAGNLDAVPGVSSDDSLDVRDGQEFPATDVADQTVTTSVHNENEPCVVDEEWLEEFRAHLDNTYGETLTNLQGAGQVVPLCSACGRYQPRLPTGQRCIDDGIAYQPASSDQLLCHGCNRHVPESSFSGSGELLFASLFAEFENDAFHEGTDASNGPDAFHEDTDASDGSADTTSKLPDHMSQWPSQTEIVFQDFFVATILQTPADDCRSFAPANFKECLRVWLHGDFGEMYIVPHEFGDVRLPRPDPHDEELFDRDRHCWEADKRGINKILHEIEVKKDMFTPSERDDFIAKVADESASIRHDDFNDLINRMVKFGGPFDSDRDAATAGAIWADPLARASLLQWGSESISLQVLAHVAMASSNRRAVAHDDGVCRILRTAFASYDDRLKWAASTLVLYLICHREKQGPNERTALTTLTIDQDNIRHLLSEMPFLRANLKRINRPDAEHAASIIAPFTVFP